MKDNKGLQNSNTKESATEEIDLGAFFNFLGDVIRKIYQLIQKFLVFLLHLVLSFFLFLRGNARKLIIASMIGAIVGGIYQYGFKEDSYESSMMVQPNFGSVLQLYKNIDYYQSLIEQEDYERLAGALSIDMEQAKNLIQIEVNPYNNQSQNLLAYKEFLSSLDSTTSELIDFKSYSKALPIESFKYHLVNVVSKEKYLFKELESPMLSSITENSYYDNLKSTSRANLLSKKRMLENSMSELDSLRDLYKKVMIAESAKENSGTNIFLAESGLDGNKDKDIFDMYLDLNESLIEVNAELTEQNEVINVISSFNSIGMKVNGWYRNFMVIGALIGFSLVFVISALARINEALDKVELGN